MSADHPSRAMEEIRVVRTYKRRAERKRRFTRGPADFQLFKEKGDFLMREIESSHQFILQGLHRRQQQRQRKLFRVTVNSCLQHYVHQNIKHAKLTTEFGAFFLQRIDTNRSSMPASGPFLTASARVELFCDTCPSEFTSLSETEVSQLINSFSNKTCSFYPIPANLVISCMDAILLPAVTKMINLSLTSGRFPRE